MPGMKDVTATRRIRERFPQVKVLVLTSDDADEWVFDAVRSGAAGYLPKETPREELVKAIWGALARETYVSPAVAGKLLQHAARTAPPRESTVLGDLTARERDVLRLLARGLGNADIAARLYLSEGMVCICVSSILAKMDVEDRTLAAVLALRYGLGVLGEEP